MWEFLVYCFQFSTLQLLSGALGTTKPEMLERITFILLITFLLSCKTEKVVFNKIENSISNGNLKETSIQLSNLSDTTSCRYFRLQGDYLRLSGKYRESIEEYQKFESKCGSDFEVINNIGDCYFKLGLGNNSYNYFAKAYLLDSTNNTINYNLGLLNYTSNYDEKAKKYFKKAINYSKGIDFDSYDMLIELHNSKSQFDSSFAIANFLINNSKTEQELGRSKLTEAFIYGDMKKFNQCRVLIDSVLGQNKLDQKTEYNGYYNRYLCNYMLNDTAQACKDYSKLKFIDPNEGLNNYFECK